MSLVRCAWKQRWQEMAALNVRSFLLQGTNLGLVVTAAIVLWKAFMLLSGSDSPIVVVLSESMQPGFFRGDILFLYQSRAPLRAGDILVFNLPHKPRPPGAEMIPIVHRAVQVHERSPNGDIDILTKGDFNEQNDRAGGIYDGIEWLHRQHVLGRVVGYLPYAGHLTLIMTDYPNLKYALIAIFGYLIFMAKE